MPFVEDKNDFTTRQACEYVDRDGVRRFENGATWNTITNVKNESPSDERHARYAFWCDRTSELEDEFHKLQQACEGGSYHWPEHVLGATPTHYRLSDGSPDNAAALAHIRHLVVQARIIMRRYESQLPKEPVDDVELRRHQSIQQGRLDQQAQRHKQQNAVRAMAI